MGATTGIVSTALLIAPQFPQRLDGVRPEASGVARPTLAPSMLFRLQHLLSSRLSTFPSLSLQKYTSTASTHVMALRSARMEASRLP